ncbi:MAG TPA: ATP-binding protein [Chloroflexota bacterium]|nr:ATP-binding protein [Chloroflexota bacterium]
MSKIQDKQAAIFVEETYRFEVTLDSLPTTQWKEGKGLIQVKLPYDGTLFEENASGVEMLALGEILVQMRDDNNVQTEKWPISIAAGKNWLHYLKSAKRAVCRAEYELKSPQETLVSIVGEVRDAPPRTETRPGDQGAFQNPLQLQLSLWLPDFYKTGAEDETDEIHRLLLRREHTQQIFMQNSQVAFEQKLAENLVALANTYGGIILIGISDKGKVQGLSEKEAKDLPRKVIRALLQTSPIVPLQRAELCETRRGKVYLLKIGSGERGVVHATKGVVYRREKKQNVRDIATAVTPSPPPSPPIPKSLTDLFRSDDTGKLLFESTNEVVTLELLTGLKDLNLGHYICGMINARLDPPLGTATVVIRAPRQTTTNSSNFSHKQIESYLNGELKQLELQQLTPKVLSGNITITATENHVFAVIRIPIEHIPIALYGKEGKGYNWRPEGRLESIAATDLLSHYLLSVSGDSHNRSAVSLESAYVTWPIHPPETVPHYLITEKEENTVVHIVQHQALAWQPSDFSREEDTVGFSISLDLPLRHAALTLDETGQLVSLSPVVTGQIVICLEDMLVSGCEISVVEDDTAEEDEDNYLQNLPIIKHTCLLIDFTAYLNELLKDRTRWSYLEFSLPEVMLDSDRVRDIIKVCADVGFRLYPAPGPFHPMADAALSEVQIFKKQFEENGRPLILSGVIRGIRSHRFFDIELGMGWSSIRTEVTRELHYEDVFDTGKSNAYTTTYYIYLWGTTEAQSEIGQLQMQLYELIRKRLYQEGTK